MPFTVVDGRYRDRVDRSLARRLVIGSAYQAPAGAASRREVNPGVVVAVTRKRVGRRTVTVGELRSLLAMVPYEAPLLVGIRDRHHFATLLGELPVAGAGVLPSGPSRAVVFDVDTVS